MIIIILLILGVAYGYGFFRIILKNYVDMTNIKEIIYSIVFGIITFLPIIIGFYEPGETFEGILSNLSRMALLFMLIQITTSLIFLYASSKSYKATKNGKYSTNIYIIVVLITCIIYKFSGVGNSILLVIIPIFTFVVILPHWLLIKKLSHDVKIKLSIVLLIIGILMLIGGLLGFNSTSQRAYHLEDSVTNTIKNNVNTYLDNNNEELKNENNMYSWIFIIGVLFTVEGSIILIGSGKKHEETVTTIIEKSFNIKNKNNENVENIKKLSELLKDGILTEDEFNKKVIGLVSKENQNAFCPNCGIKISSNNKFCIKCGTNIEMPNSTSTIEAITNVNNTNTEVNKTTSKDKIKEISSTTNLFFSKGKRKKIFLSSIGLFSVIIMCFLSWHFILKKEDATYKTSASKETKMKQSSSDSNDLLYVGTDGKTYRITEATIANEMKTQYENRYQAISTCESHIEEQIRILWRNMHGDQDYDPDKYK